MTISTGPKRASAAASAVGLLPAAVAAIKILCAWLFAAPMASTVLASASARRAETVPRAPRAARHSAKKRPKPLDPPVTITCFPPSVNGSIIGASCKRSLRILPNLAPHQDRAPHRSIQIAFVGGRRDRERVPVQNEVPDLVSAGPCLVPRGFDVLNNNVVSKRERAGIGNHGTQQLDAFFVGRHHVARRDAIITGEDGVHPAIGGIDDISYRSFPELVVPLPVRQAPAP